MGLYIRPATSVKERGRNIPLPASWSAAQKLLGPGEKLAAVARRPHGLVALVIAHEGDFDHVSQAGGDIYIIDAELAKKAS